MMEVFSSDVLVGRIECCIRRALAVERQIGDMVGEREEALGLGLVDSVVYYDVAIEAATSELLNVYEQVGFLMVDGYRAERSE